MVKRARKVTKSGRKSTLSVNRLLTRDLLEDTSRLGDGITGLTDADVDDELLNSDVTHNISLLALQTVSTILVAGHTRTIVLYGKDANAKSTLPRQVTRVETAESGSIQK